MMEKTTRDAEFSIVIERRFVLTRGGNFRVVDFESHVLRTRFEYMHV